MQRLCLSGFRLVALFCCLVAPPFAVHDAHNQRQQVAMFIANLALFQQRVSAIRGRNSGCSAVRGLPEIRSDCTISNFN